MSEHQSPEPELRAEPPSEGFEQEPEPVEVEGPTSGEERQRDHGEASFFSLKDNKKCLD